MILRRKLTNNADNNDILLLQRKDSAEICVSEMQNKVVSNKKFNKVSFCSEVIMTETLHHKNYSKEEKLSCWYNTYDFSAMRKEYQEILRLAISGEIHQRDENETGREYCLRGLEHRLVERSEERKSMRLHGRMLVFNEQAVQMQQGTRDAEAIAEEYTLLSEQCAFEAYNIGLMDEVDAFNDESSARKARISIDPEKKRAQRASYFSNLFLARGESLRNYLSCTDL
mmetsp:Transcript_14504/g.21382  ORF Transcript_14504/g.21382 Transcript_14504/m.21382 type:complete len:227 (+) Transcript_14504:55-735(+)